MMVVCVCVCVCACVRACVRVCVCVNKTEYRSMSFLTKYTNTTFELQFSIFDKQVYIIIVKSSIIGETSYDIVHS